MDAFVSIKGQFFNAYRYTVIFPATDKGKLVLLLQPVGAKYFLYELTPTVQEDTINGRAVSLESVPIHH